MSGYMGVIVIASMNGGSRDKVCQEESADAWILNIDVEVR